MSDIFISYSREDQEQAKALAKALKTQDWSIFWDRTIPAGEPWREYIEMNLKTARCIVVAWSTNSIQSIWVQEEADNGYTRKILVPVFFERVQPPLGFRAIQTIDLSNWNKSNTFPAFQDLVNAISRILKLTPDKTELPNKHHHQDVTKSSLVAKAVKWYHKVAAQADAKAQYDLGVMYDNAKDKAKAVKWYREAATQGNAEAQYNLGMKYDNGEGVAKDKVKAVEWYRKAAAQGDAEAQYNLGVMYNNGKGVAKDKVEAVKWYRRAAAQGDTDAKKILRKYRSSIL